MILIMVIVFGVLIARHYYYKHQAEQVLDEYIALYHFPAGKVTVEPIYKTMKGAYTYVKEVHIKANKKNYYVFAYDWKSKSVDLSGVLDNGLWAGLDEKPFLKLKYQPSHKFIVKYNKQSLKFSLTDN